MRGFILSFALFLESSSIGESVRSELPHAKTYTVVKPQKLPSRTKRSLSSKAEYPDGLQYALAIEGKNYTVNLKKNRFLLGKQYTETYYLHNGTEITLSPDNEDHCYYHGYIQDVKDSSVSVAMCSGMRGFVRAKNTVYLIEPLVSSTDGAHAVYRQEHLRRKRATCGNVNDTRHDYGPAVSGLFNPSGWKSKTFAKQQRFVEMFMVVDKTEYKNFGEDMRQIRARMMEVANHVDKLYRPVNIRVMLVGLEVWSDTDKITVSTNPDETLTNFLKWRQTSLKTNHDNAQFVTGIDFTGDTVGLANKFAMCEYGSGAVNQDHSTNAIGVASTIAHEMGHNLGLSHDTPDCFCSSSPVNKKCIMADSVGIIFPEQFSSCSLQDMQNFLETRNPQCLLNTPGSERVFGGPVCGNAFLEAGEECDCGTAEECQDPCCNATTCRLTKGSQCAHGECCENCQLKQTGTLCRDAADECDIKEYCTGYSGECPKNVFKMNGVSCNHNKSYCYNGQCPTLLKQCNDLWGPDSQVAKERCFSYNTQGTRDAYCRKTGHLYRGCEKQDMKCGRLFCMGGNEIPKTLAKKVFSIGGMQCNMALSPHDDDDVGMVLMGTRCADGKVCYNNMCQDIEVYGNQDCPEKCNHRGECNHEGECSCIPGWAPPYCAMKHSDIAQGRSLVVIGVLVSVVVLILLTLVIAGLMCCRKPKKMENCKTNRKAHGGSGLSNPLFQDGTAKGRPASRPREISQSTFVESSAAQACAPLVFTVSPSRENPTPTKPSFSPPTCPNKAIHTQQRKPPPPPTKPLPPLTTKPACKPSLFPPVPPVKPKPTHDRCAQAASEGQKVALRPPAVPR